MGEIVDHPDAIDFATNLLAIIVPRGNPKGVTGVDDLDRSDLKVVLCADGVPCGTYANQIFGAAEVTVTPVSLEQNVKGVVTKVTSGEADAGIVYATDVTAAGNAAQAVAIPTDINVVAQYPAAAVTASSNLSAARAFVDYLLGPDAQAILARSREYAENRLVCGVHYRSDIVAGQQYGTILALRLMENAAFQAQLAIARNELQAAQ